MSNGKNIGSRNDEDIAFESDQNFYSLRGELTFNQVDGLFASDEPYHEIKLSGFQPHSGHLLRDEECGDQARVDANRAVEEASKASKYFLDAGVVEDIVLEYQKLPTHHNATKTTDQSSWKVCTIYSFKIFL